MVLDSVVFEKDSEPTGVPSCKRLDDGLGWWESRAKGYGTRKIETMKRHFPLERQIENSTMSRIPVFKRGNVIREGGGTLLENLI